ALGLSQQGIGIEPHVRLGAEGIAQQFTDPVLLDRLAVQPQLVVALHRTASIASRCGSRASSLRSVARPLAAWLLTVPSAQPSICATSSIGRSSQYRSTMTARCRAGSMASTRRASRV